MRPSGKGQSKYIAPILSYIEAHPGCNAHQIARSLGANPYYIRGLVHDLTQRGRVIAIRFATQRVLYLEENHGIRD